jgi:hypothetical protein
MRNTPADEAAFAPTIDEVGGSVFQRVRLQLFERDELERGSMSSFKIDGRGAAVVERRFPTRDANAPFVPGFKARKSPLRMWRDQIVSIQHREIQKLPSDLHAHSMQADIFRASATESIAIKSGDRITATTFEFCAQYVRRHEFQLNHSRSKNRQSNFVGKIDIGLGAIVLTSRKAGR